MSTRVPGQEARGAKPGVPPPQPRKRAVETTEPTEENGQRRSGPLRISEQRLARGLGWFSIGLGLAEVLAPDGMAKLAGVSGNHSTVVRLLGMREIAHGVTILSQRRPLEGVWSRVGGDAIDLAGMALAFGSPQANRGRLAIATAAVLGVTALDVLCAQQLARDPSESTEGGAIRVRLSSIVDRPAEEVYQFWHDFENLPRFMAHLESVAITGPGQSHWVAKGPAGSAIEWDAEIVEDRPNEMISWRSLEGSDVPNFGSVMFGRAPGGRGTMIHVELEYLPMGGVIGAGIARLFGEEPTGQVKDDLRRFKQIMEVGEILKSDGSPGGTGDVAQRPAQPLADGEIEQRGEISR